MAENITNEFSFILKPSKYGIGVFATHDIKKGTYLRLFGDEQAFDHRVRALDNKDVPKIFQDYCINRGDKSICPQDFGCMPIGWYLNHSKNYNAIHKDYHWYASCDIKEGEETLINYNSLEEPENYKRNYYKN